MTGTRYRTICADPPWPVHAMRRANVRRGDHYPVMQVEEIASLTVGDLAAEDAHLYCWAVLPLMAEAYDVVRAWGFAPVTLLTWCKPGPGLGGGFRGNTEHLIVARRGESFYNPTCATCRGRARGAHKCSCKTPDWRYRGERTVYTRQFADTATGTWYVASRQEHSRKPDLFLDLIERMSPGPYLELFACRQRLGWDAMGDAIDGRDIREAMWLSLGGAEQPTRLIQATVQAVDDRHIDVAAYLNRQIGGSFDWEKT